MTDVNELNKFYDDFYTSCDKVIEKIDTLNNESQKIKYMEELRDILTPLAKALKDITK